jgi:hypothetical protein
MRRYPWGLLGPILFSLACLLFAVSYSLDHPHATIPAYLTYLTIGCLGIFVSVALASLHRRIATLETRLSHQ